MRWFYRSRFYRLDVLVRLVSGVHAMAVRDTAMTDNTETVRRLREWAQYLDDLQNNMLRNDADMAMDKCKAPEIVAEEIRAFIERLGAGDGAGADLDAIEARLKAATPGPWEGIDQEREHHHFKFVRSKTAVHKNDRGPDYAYEILSDEDYDTKSADVNFIAHVRTDTATLLTEVRRLRAALEPFARTAKYVDGGGVERVFNDCREITLGDLRRAREALSPPTTRKEKDEA